ncbi:MAG: SCO family protein [Candidatus Schekmanbacteria bacterium]|nr:SCO family protein [Candidatus Schekmanbacteria bacterium]
MMKRLIDAVLISCVCTVLFLPLKANAETERSMKNMDMNDMNMKGVKEDQFGTNEKYKRTIEKYAVPDVTLVDQNGKKVKLREILNSKKIVIVDFIFTTCTTICPVLSAGYVNFQRKVDTNTADVRLVSISIDPENDIPKKMNEYLKQYDAKPGWDFLTGSREDIDKVLTAFKALIPNKMSHIQLVLLHTPADDKWVRIFGLVGTSDFLTEYEKLHGK